MELKNRNTQLFKIIGKFIQKELKISTKNNIHEFYKEFNNEFLNRFWPIFRLTENEFKGFK